MLETPMEREVAPLAKRNASPHIRIVFGVKPKLAGSFAQLATLPELKRADAT